MADSHPINTVRIEPVEKRHGILALGTYVFGGLRWGGQNDADSFAAMQAALQCRMNHFDTAIS